MTTEANWLACSNPYEALNAVPGGVSQRKLRLVAVACCRRIWGLLPDRECRHVVEFAERHADGDVGEAERTRLNNHMGSITAAYHAAAAPPGSRAAIRFVASVAAAHAIAAAPRTGRVPVGDHVTCADTWVSAVAATYGPARPPRHGWDVRLGAISQLPEARFQCGLVRDITGNPYRRAELAPSCRTSTALSLAQAAYEERSLPSGHLDPARLAILSDALEEAGCTDETILYHLRSPGPHVRGCWALDLVLGKQ